MNFVSKGYGGRVSDKYITEDCGYLHKLQPQDVVLADGGFNVEDSIAYRCATLNIPAFTRGKFQLNPKDVETTRKLANVRIHVERVIGLYVKGLKYSMLPQLFQLNTLGAKEEVLYLITVSLEYVAQYTLYVMSLSL